MCSIKEDLLKRFFTEHLWATASGRWNIYRIFPDIVYMQETTEEIKFSTPDYFAMESYFGKLAGRNV